MSALRPVDVGTLSPERGVRLALARPLAEVLRPGTDAHLAALVERVTRAHALLPGVPLQVPAAQLRALVEALTMANSLVDSMDRALRHATRRALGAPHDPEEG